MTENAEAAARTEDRPLVSVIVTPPNVERTLDACLTSIQAQDYPAFELIVVDNHSTDSTAAIAARHTDQFLVAGPERSAQRNLGVRTAAGEWIMWIDADMVLEPDVVTQAVAAAERTGAVAVSVPERTVGPGFWTACRTLERSCYLDDSSLFNPRLLRRDYLLGLGGFDLGMSGPEDTDLRLRLHADGAVLAHTEAFIDHDEGRLTLGEVVRKRVYYGRSLPAFAAANPGAVRGQARSTVAAFARHRGRLARDPAHAAGLLLMRSVEAGAYVVGAAQGRRARR
jgi:glycosyltransferase involved in cell wall biosynthesis